MSESWTPRQAEAIETRNKNILVSAAAGSGKTAVLVERIKRLIIDEHVSVDEILVATFTNAAAGDMKGKIVKALQKAISGSRTPDERRFLKNQFNKVYKANISTFHSFAIEVIRRYFYVIGVDPDFKICDESEKTILQAEAVDELFDEKFEADDDEFIGFLKAYCTAKSEKKAKEMVLDLYEKIQALPEPFKWLSGKTGLLGGADDELYEYLKPFILGDIIDNLGYALSALRKVREILEVGGIDGLAAKCSLDIESVDNVLRRAQAGEFEETARVICNVGFQRFAASKDEKAAYDEIKDRVGKIRDKAKDIIKGIRDSYFGSEFSEAVGMIRKTYKYTETLAGLISGFDAIYKGKKKEKALLDFNDTEHLAIEILKNGSAAEEYRKKFKYIFVDEYQDSNMLQETMVSLISRDDNVFMVGDVKQSIYKFRLAEPEIFIEKYERYKNAAGERDVKIDLNTNFRCKGNIINAVNDICGRIMPYDENAALHQGVSYKGELDYPVSLHIVETKEIEDGDIDPEINDMKKAELEAAVAVKLIKSVVGKKINEKGKEGTESERPVGFKDVVILMRSVKSYGDKFYQILSDSDIPAYIDDSDGYFDTIEIEIFMNLLKIIDNKRRDIPLISVMYSSIMGFSAEELARIRAECRGTSYFMAFERYKDYGENERLKAKCGDAYERIEGWRELALSIPIDELIWKLMWDTGYYIYAGALPGGGQRQANLRALADKALQFAGKRGDSLYGFIQYAEMLKGRSVSIGQVSMAGESGDVVRIKTVHKSKGLEFPVVIVSGLGKKLAGGREKSDALMHKDIGIALPFYDSDGRRHEKTILQTLIENKNKMESMDEEARILYVALTRAKDMLFLVGTVLDVEQALLGYKNTDAGNRKMVSCFLDMIAPVFLEKGLRYEIHGRGGLALSKTGNKGFKEELKDMITGSGDSSGKTTAGTFVNERLSYEYEYKKALSAKSKYSVSEINRGPAQATAVKSPSVPLFMQGKRKLTGAEIGAAYHVVMEKADFKAAALSFDKGKGQDYFEGLLAELKDKSILTPDAAETINLKWVESFIKSDIGRRAAKADRVYKETPFNIIKEIDGIDTIIQGVIDCWFEEDGEYVLVDYKSDHIAGGVESIRETYAGQLELYGEALEIIKGARVKEKYLYLLSGGVSVKVD